jgi:hypothetical protein
MGEEVQTLREGAFMLRYMHIACLIKTDNRNTEQILSTSASSQFMSIYTTTWNQQKCRCQVIWLHETNKNAVGFGGSSPFKNKVHLTFTLLIASSQESNLRHPRECEILSLSALNVIAAPR